MVLDYKDYDKLLSYNKKRNIFHTLGFILVFIIIVAAIAFVISWRNNTQLNKLMSALKYDETQQFIESHYFFFHAKSQDEARALIKLVRQPDAAADSFFAENSPDSFPSYWNKYVQYFFNEGNYRVAQTYMDYLSGKFSDRELSDYHCISDTILNNFSPSNNCLSAVATPAVKPYAAMLAQTQRTKKFDWIFDKNGIPLLYRNIVTGKEDYYYDELRWLKPEEMLSLNDKDRLNRIYLTIDITLQKAAYKALGKYNGSILLSGKKGNLLAMVSKTDDNGIPVFFRLMKPGSICKIVTASSALRNKLDLSKIFPVDCKGFIVPYDNYIFYDWIAHKKVNTLVEALSSSCNVSFGIIGHYLKTEALKKEFANFGINKKIKLESVEFDAGKIIDSTTDPAYEYSLAIGDRYVLISPMLAELWASSLINDGIAMNPYMLREIKSITGNSYRTAREEIFMKFTHKDYLPLIKEGMINAVESDIGTGKNARLSNYRIAFKTGTAGNKKPDYDAIIIGFAPVESPQFAFSLFAVHAGKASLEGARIIKEFLSEALPHALPPP
jgi:penicillin-binding protein A